MLAQLYRALNQVGVPPKDADELELWQCAVLLGAGITVKEKKPTRASGLPQSFRQRNMELFRQRMLHAQGQGPKPEVRGISTAAAASLFGE